MKTIFVFFNNLLIFKLFFSIFLLLLAKGIISLLINYIEEREVFDFKIKNFKEFLLYFLLLLLFFYNFYYFFYQRRYKIIGTNFDLYNGFKDIKEYFDYNFSYLSFAINLLFILSLLIFFLSIVRIIKEIAYENLEKLHLFMLSRIKPSHALKNIFHNEIEDERPFCYYKFITIFIKIIDYFLKGISTIIDFFLFFPLLN